MPERRPLLRRAAYLAAVTTTIGVFAGSLAGIASTQGQVKPNGDAAALARKLQHREDVRIRATATATARPSRRHRRRRSARSSARALTSPAATRARQRVLRIGLEVVDEARRRLHALDPRAHRRASGEIHVDVARQVDVGPQREVGDRVPIARHPLAAVEVRLEPVDRGLAAREAVGEDLGRERVAAGQAPEARAAEVGLDVVLLDEQPLVHVRPRHRIGRQQVRALGEVEQDGARLGDRRAVGQFQHRGTPERIAPPVLRRGGVAAEDVHARRGGRGARAGPAGPAPSGSWPRRRSRRGSVRSCADNAPTRARDVRSIRRRRPCAPG